MKKLILTLLLLMVSAKTLANIYVDIEIVDRKGLNKGLVLISELYSVEYVDEREMIVLEMGDGLRFQFEFSVVPNIQSSTQQVVLEKGVVLKANGDEFAKLNEKPDAMSIGTKKAYSISSKDKDEVIQINITPFSRKHAR